MSTRVVVMFSAVREEGGMVIGGRTGIGGVGGRGVSLIKVVRREDLP